MLPMFRNGFEEETYFTVSFLHITLGLVPYANSVYISQWSYVPIRVEDGSIGGLLNPNIETTTRVLAERGLTTLRNLATATGS